MPGTATLERISEVRSRLFDDSRVSVSDFARGREWRTKLQSNAFVELQEHGDRIAWVISEEGMKGVFDYIRELEEQVERASIRAMFETRKGQENWKTGEELKTDALAYFRAHEGELMKVANGD